MGYAIDLQSFSVTAPGASGAALVPFSSGPDTLTIRNARAGADILCIAMWTKAQLAGKTRLLSAFQHDAVNGYTYKNIANGTDNKIPAGFPLHFKPQEALVLTQFGSATGGDVENVHMLNWYEDLPGVEGRFINVAELRRRGVMLTTVDDSSTASAGGGAYSGPRLINAANDFYKPDTDYAILGAVVGGGTVVSCLAVQSTDFGNLRVGIPGGQLPDITKDWFVMLSEMHDLPAIPVFNSSNRNSINITTCQDENVAAVPFTLVLCQLAPDTSKNQFVHANVRSTA